MTEFRYAQFCPLARAAEILGERWTLLVIRELWCGPQRFSDLRRRLPGLSSSVLSERLGRLEELGLVEREEIPPPSAASVYALSEAGRGLEPVLQALVRFGVRYLGPPRPGDHIEPEWIRLALETFARRGPTPPRRIEIRIPDAGRDVVIHVSGSRRGTRVRRVDEASDAQLHAPPLVVLGLASAGLELDAARRDGRVQAAGDLEALRELPAYFDMRSNDASDKPSERS